MYFLYLFIVILILVFLFWKSRNSKTEEASAQTEDLDWKRRAMTKGREDLEEYLLEEETCEELCRLQEGCIPVYHGKLIRSTDEEGIYIQSVDGEKVKYLAFRRGFRVEAGIRCIELTVYAKELKKGFTEIEGGHSSYGPHKFHFLFEQGKEYELDFLEEELRVLCREREEKR